MKQLKKEIDRILNDLGVKKEMMETICRPRLVFPFSETGDILAYLLSAGGITYQQYKEIEDEYCSRNKYLELYDMAPRTYGQTWGERHIYSLFPQFVKATKDNMALLYPDFDGEFDLWIDGIRVEVKACRANSTGGSGGLASRAYLHEEARKAGFKYHFQQIKPSCCDVFIWIGTCRDELLYWVLTSEEVIKTGKLGPQHRNENTGIVGTAVYEGQVFMTEEELEPFCVKEADILKAVCGKGKT